MQFQWLNRENNLDCILLVAGWGMSLEPFQDMVAGPVDVVMVYDYRGLDEFNLSALPSDLKNYNIHLLAWSMGVGVAGMLLDNISFAFSSATAIGGTCRPIDDRYGIPCRLFDDTIADFSPAVLNNFYTSMFDNIDQSDQFLNHLPNRPEKELKEELISLRAACRVMPEVPDIFQRRIVTSRDRIFPVRNQIRSWGRDNCESIALPHFPFYQWSSWAELLKRVYK
jgi:biotin synthesis protein BioG